MGGCMATPKTIKNGSSEKEPYSRKLHTKEKRGSSKGRKKSNEKDDFKPKNGKTVNVDKRKGSSESNTSLSSETSHSSVFNTSQTSSHERDNTKKQQVEDVEPGNEPNNVDVPDADERQTRPENVDDDGNMTGDQGDVYKDLDLPATDGHFTWPENADEVANMFEDLEDIIRHLRKESVSSSSSSDSTCSSLSTIYSEGEVPIPTLPPKQRDKSEPLDEQRCGESDKETDIKEPKDHEEESGMKPDLEEQDEDVADETESKSDINDEEHTSDLKPKGQENETKPNVIIGNGDGDRDENNLDGNIEETNLAVEEDGSNPNNSENENNDEISNIIEEPENYKNVDISPDEDKDTDVTHTTSDVKTEMDLLVEEMGLSDNAFLDEITIEWTSITNSNVVQPESTVVYEDNMMKSVDSALYATAIQETPFEQSNNKSINVGSYDEEVCGELSTDEVKQIDDESRMLQEEKVQLRKKCNDLQEEMKNLFLDKNNELDEVKRKYEKEVIPALTSEIQEIKIENEKKDRRSGDLVEFLKRQDNLKGGYTTLNEIIQQEIEYKSGKIVELEARVMELEAMIESK